MTSLGAVLRADGIPLALYTDRAHWAFHTPTAKGPWTKRGSPRWAGRWRGWGSSTFAYSPQARGRSERLNRTFQDRLVNQLRVAGIATLEAANRYLAERFVPQHNATFARPPRDPASAFVALGDADLDPILATRSRASSPVITRSAWGAAFCIFDRHPAGGVVWVYRSRFVTTSTAGSRSARALARWPRSPPSRNPGHGRGEWPPGRTPGAHPPRPSTAHGAAQAGTGGTLAKAVRSLVKQKRTHHLLTTPALTTREPRTIGAFVAFGSAGHVRPFVTTDKRHCQHRRVQRT